MTVCTHTHSYWAGIVRTCPMCRASYETPSGGASEPDETVWLRDLDGTGSMHVCTPYCPGAVEYIRADTSPWHSTEER